MTNFLRRSVLLGAGASAVMPVLPSLASVPVYREIRKIENPGKVSGTVFYRGQGVETPTFPVIKDHHVCGHDDRAPKALRVDENTQTLGDVVIEIQGIDAGKPWKPVFNHGKIYQIDCGFQPYVQIIRSQAFVDVFNHDPILHNIHAYEVYKGTRRSMFNIAQPEKGQVDRIDLNFRRGNILMIDCNAHNWMAAFVYTSATPYLTVTGLNGKFEIDDVPPGSYVLNVWHPMLGERTGRMDVAKNADLNFNVTLD